nr:hypothetical protein [uncultured Flavobacterium sp.]
MKNLFLSIFSLFSIYMSASATDPVKNIVLQIPANAVVEEPYPCTATLLIYNGGTTPVNLEVKFSNDKTQKDCDAFGKAEGDKLQKKLGKNFTVKVTATLSDK